MASYSTSDLSRRSGDIIADALREPVVITQRKKPRLVLLSVEDYRRLMERGQTRRSMTLESMPGDLLSEFEKAIDVYEAEREAP